MSRLTVRTRVHRFDADGEITARADRLAGEEPLEIRLNGEQYAVTMRTPGQDVELIHGFLFSEAVITEAAQVRSIDFASGLDPDGRRNYNVAQVRLAPEVTTAPRPRRVYTSSACGICGTSSLDAVRQTPAAAVCRHMAQSTQTGLLSPAAVLALPDRLRAEQRIFDTTGGAHAAALFRVRERGDLELMVAREDIGRHHALDKALGWALLKGLLPLHDVVVQVSARASFELVQKAAMAGAPVLSAVSAPSALAVEVGDDLGVTVIGFNRGRTCNVYTHPERLR